MLAAVEDGPFTVTVTGRHHGVVTYRQERAGVARRGQGMRAEIIQVMTGGGDPCAARIGSAGVSALRPEWVRPGTVVLLPLELAAPRL